LIGTTVESAAAAVSGWGFAVTPEMLTEAAKCAGETSVLSRVGGAPTLALAMAQILAAFLGGPGATAFWYHFAILFEALFILTTLDAGTRVGRFLIQDFLGRIAPAWQGTGAWGTNLAATALCVGAWGWFLYQGVVDPLGGINSLWPLFGIANQMLAGIALTLATAVLVKRGRGALAAVTAVPLAWLLVCTLTAGWQKLFHADAKIGFLAHLEKFRAALDRGEVLAPAKSLAQMRQVIANDSVDAVLCAALILVVVAVAIAGLRAMRGPRVGAAAPEPVT
jgi:carbon starvation protein